MKAARSLVPRPLLSLLLWVVWLLLNNTLSPGHILLGLVLAILIPQITYYFWDPQPDVKRPILVVRFVLRVLADIVIANLQVARLILGPEKNLRPGFIELPIDLTQDFPITLLASTVSLTPGTVSSQLSEDRKRLLIHVLDMDDEQALIEEIKTRYEKPLREIFGC